MVRTYSHTHNIFTATPVPPTPTSLRYIPLRAHHPSSPHPLARRSILARPHPPFAPSAETRASDPSLIRGLGNQVAAHKTSEARKLVCPRLGSELSSEPSLGTRPSLGSGLRLGSESEPRLGVVQCIARPQRTTATIATNQRE